MRRDRAGSAIAARDAGLRRVTRLTWQLAAAGAVCSALIAAAFGHGTSQHGTSQHGAGQQSTGQQSTGRTGASQHGTGHHRAKHPGSGLVIPSQPPAPAPGDGQVTSGGS
jgi:hypothetical protein